MLLSKIEPIRRGNQYEKLRIFKIECEKIEFEVMQF